MERVTKEFYNDNEWYTKYLASLSPANYEKYIRKIQAIAAGEILDVGCGAGQVVGGLRAAGLHAYGCDVSKTSIALATNQFGPYFTHLTDGIRLPYADGAFSVVGAFTVFEHVEDPSELLDEMCRILAPLGSLIIFSPNMLSLSWPRRRCGITNLLAIRAQNMRYLAARAVGLPYPKKSEFIHIENWVNPDAFEVDDDAICLTNYFDMRRALLRRGLCVHYFSATQFERTSLGGRLVDCLYESPLGWLLGGVFVISGAKRRK